MSQCNLVINGKTVTAKIGETLIDAGLGGWIAIPHDCCSGQCDSCRVTVVRGKVDDQGTAERDTVLACQATVIGDAAITFEDVPVLTKRSGQITEITPLGHDVVQVVVTTTAPMVFRPGQYLKVKFSGFPTRELSPSERLDGSRRPGEVVFHIRRYPGGLVSTQIGATIRVGHRVQLRGPFGHAFLREGHGPLVLIGGGTGWAPIWSLALAARHEQRHRDLLVIAGARSPHDFYMGPAIEWLIDDGVREIVSVTETGAIDRLLPGRPTHYLPLLGPEDTVFVAGPSGLVDAVKGKARASGARCYADPFTPSAQSLSLLDRVMQMLRRPAAEPVIAPPRPSLVAGTLASDLLRPEPVSQRAPAVKGAKARQHA